MLSPPDLEEKLRKNLEKPLSELFESGSEILISDPALHDAFLFLTINFEE